MAVARLPIDEPLAASGPFERLAFSPDEMLLAAARGHAVELRHGTTGQPLRGLSGHADDVQDVAFSPKGERLATIARDQTVKIWDAATGQIRQSYPIQHPTSVRFSPDGSRTGIASWAGPMLLDRSGEFTVWLPEKSLSSAVFSPDGLAAAVALYDVATGQRLHEWSAICPLSTRWLSHRTTA